MNEFQNHVFAKGNVQCDFIGMFITVNSDGKLFQSPSQMEMIVTIKNLTPEDFPFSVRVAPQPQSNNRKIEVSTVSKVGYPVVLEQYGHYTFALEKTTIKRLPYPYS